MRRPRTTTSSGASCGAAAPRSRAGGSVCVRATPPNAFTDNTIRATNLRMGVIPCDRVRVGGLSLRAWPSESWPLIMTIGRSRRSRAALVRFVPEAHALRARVRIHELAIVLAYVLVHLVAR